MNIFTGFLWDEIWAHFSFWVNIWVFFAGEMKYMGYMGYSVIHI
jgi:hypothetical protein